MPLGLRWTENINQQALQKEDTKNEKSFDRIPITVLTKSVALKGLIINLHQTMWFGLR